MNRVPTERRDGRLVSLSPDALNLLALTDSIHVLRQKFAAKGLNNHDLYIRLCRGTHHWANGLFVLPYRLYNFMEKGNADPTINQAFLAQLHALCPECGNVSTRVPLDKDSQIKFDVSFFKNVRVGNGVLESNQRIFGDSETQRIVKNYAGNVRG
ncbi:Peroxidase 25 [Vitis vinifera]|uniref:peroxidase n=1 Tax=Vitis vinifera TaxID=29760 RepID=A0A438JQ26_VITVI|nr:Peroxidase 25 [Vitis vinifera]